MASLMIVMSNFAGAYDFLIALDSCLSFGRDSTQFTGIKSGILFYLRKEEFGPSQKQRLLLKLSCKFM